MVIKSGRMLPGRGEDDGWLSGNDDNIHAHPWSLK